jgi:hypothetical protein
MGMDQRLYIRHSETGVVILKIYWRECIDIHRWMFKHVLEQISQIPDEEFEQGHFKLTRGEFLQFIRYCKHVLNATPEEESKNDYASQN